MRIGIDARELGARATGVGRYLRGLLAEWAADRSRHRFLLYTHQPESIPGLDASHIELRPVAGHGGSVWEQWQLPRAATHDDLDVFFSPGYTAPPLATPVVVAIHDISYVAHPEWFRVREGMRRRLLTGRAAARACAVVTISAFSKRELVERLGVPEGRIHVIPPGITPPETDVREAGPVEPAGSPALTGARVLYVGSIFNRRHVPDLIQACAQLARSRSTLRLDLVGDNRSYPHEDIRAEIERAGMSARAAWHEYISDGPLRDLYRAARAFAFLSEYEGLGLTPLEALSCGVPVVLLDTDVARESCGDAALYVRAERRSIADALELALFDDATRARLLGAAPATLARYSWPRAARATLSVLETCAGAGKR